MAGCGTEELKISSSSGNGETSQPQDHKESFIMGERTASNLNISGSSSSGMYSSNVAEIKEKQNSSAKILDEIKKHIDKHDLPKLLGVFKEVKDCEKMEPVFKRLKSIFFGNHVGTNLG